MASGQVYHGNAKQDDLTETYICIRNKSSNKVRILPIEQVQLTNNIYEQLNKETEKTEMSKQESVQALLKQFGGRKASRYIDNQEKMKMDINIVKTELDQTVEDTKIVEDDVESALKGNGNDAEAHFSAIRPPCNKDAKNIDDIYKIENVIPPSLLSRLEEEAKLVYATNVNNLP